MKTVVVALLCRCVVAHAAEEPATRLLRQPAVSKEHLAFEAEPPPDYLATLDALAR